MPETTGRAQARGAVSGCSWDGFFCQGSGNVLKQCIGGNFNSRAVCENHSGCHWVNSGPSVQHYSIVFKNNCRSFGQIHTAVHFRDLNGNWVSNGFWSLAYGETARVGATTNKVFYFHGHTNDYAQTWFGDSSGSWIVRNETLTFGKADMGPNVRFGDYTFVLGCDN